MGHLYMTDLPNIVGATRPIAYLIAALFAGMLLFYVLRAGAKETIVSCCGYYSPWQEVAHGLCAVGMVAMSVPRYFLWIPPISWVILFVIQGGIYLFVLVTRSPGSKPSAKWCMLHAGIFLGMAYMFLGSPWSWITWGFTLFYVYTTGVFIKEFITTVSDPPVSFYSIGVDVFHVLMCVIMVAMFAFPSILMPEMPMCLPQK